MRRKIHGLWSMVYGPKRVFTLLELTIVLVIVGVLATMATSHLAISREKALLKGALSGIKVLQAAENTRFAESGAFVACSGLPAASTNCRDTLKIDLFGFPALFTYSVTSGSPTVDFTAQVGRASGAFSTCVYALNRTQDAANYSSGTCP